MLRVEVNEIPSDNKRPCIYKRSNKLEKRIEVCYKYSTCNLIPKNRN